MFIRNLIGIPVFVGDPVWQKAARPFAFSLRSPAAADHLELRATDMAVLNS